MGKLATILNSHLEQMALEVILPGVVVALPGVGAFQAERDGVAVVVETFAEVVEGRAE